MRPFYLFIYVLTIQLSTNYLVYLIIVDKLDPRQSDALVSKSIRFENTSLKIRGLLTLN